LKKTHLNIWGHRQRVFSNTESSSLCCRRFEKGEFSYKKH
jgi:hypothetical protein